MFVAKVQVGASDALWVQLDRTLKGKGYKRLPEDDVQVIRATEVFYRTDSLPEIVCCVPVYARQVSAGVVDLVRVDVADGQPSADTTVWFESLHGKDSYEGTRQSTVGSVIGDSQPKAKVSAAERLLAGMRRLGLAAFAKPAL